MANHDQVLKTKAVAQQPAGTALGSNAHAEWRKYIEISQRDPLFDSDRLGRRRSVRAALKCVDVGQST